MTAAGVSPTALTAKRTETVLATGRDCTIFALGDDRVLRKSFNGWSMRIEADVMNDARAAGFPVPRVHSVGDGELELERIHGPTMLADLLAHPVRLSHHARMLASLHRRLGAITAPSSLRPGPVPGDRMVHLDLHPGNVILGAHGPVVIDWTHAARGVPASDIALSWSSLACFDHDATGVKGRIATRFRVRFLECFLRAAGRDEASALLPDMVAYRLDHPHRASNVRPQERDALLRLATHAQEPGFGHSTDVGGRLPRALWVRRSL